MKVYSSAHSSLCLLAPYFHFHLSFYISYGHPSQGPFTLIYLLVFRNVLNPLACNINLEMSTRAFKRARPYRDTSLFSIHENVLIVQLVRHSSLGCKLQVSMYAFQTNKFIKITLNALHMVSACQYGQA